MSTKIQTFSRGKIRAALSHLRDAQRQRKKDPFNGLAQRTTIAVDRDTRDLIHIISVAEKISMGDAVYRAATAYAVVRDLDAAAFKPRMEVRA